MTRYRLASAALVAALLFPGGLLALAKSRYRTALVLPARVKVYARASTHTGTVTVLVQQTQVEVLKQTGSWDEVRIWASVHGWIPSKSLGFIKPYPTVSTYHAPVLHLPVHATPAQSLNVAAISTAPTALTAAPGGKRTATLAGNAGVTVSAWQQDAHGAIWYRIGRSWARGDAVRFIALDPGQTRVGGKPLWTLASGKGMWLTLGIIADSNPSDIVKAAQRDGISHLYLESAISPLGFHGKGSVGPLIEAAHHAHLTVIAWVYPYLHDIASDVALTREVAAFTTPNGDRFDGIAADLEDNVQLWTVRAYSQLVRYYLGPHYLLVGVTYAPQSFPTYPFAEVAKQYNLIVPMDYWHQTKTSYGLDYGGMSYGYNYGYRYAADSVNVIKHLSGDVPVAPIGQAFDNFGRLEMGPYAPSSDETRGFLAGCKASGAVGASFFQWMTVTDGEWKAIRGFRY